MLEPDIEGQLQEEHELTELQLAAFRSSLFERMRVKLQDLEKQDSIRRVVMLDTQFRMHPVLGNFVSKHFYECENLGVLHSGRPAEAFVFSQELLSRLGPLAESYRGHVCQWIDVPAVQGRDQRRGTSRVREIEAQRIAVHIDDLESRIEQLTSAQKTQTPFPAMSLMDSERDYRARMDLDEVPDLETFATQLQHRIAKAEKHVELFYPIEDIRVLLGGLAMSQLHVFQGISGTGKTSLAKAFAKAMGGFCTDIAVQAGWRDRDDLLGHYNAFERRFYEKDCLQALYKAQTPRWEDTCNIILLDEMNLSRPEQYFAEFLSALEKNNPDERLISLSETLLSNAPAMLVEGRKIRVPANVWFIGTANHDETTNELADKTYDRAHVMTLPKQDKRFTIKPFEPANYSYRSLRKAFGKARAERKEEVVKLLKDLTGDAFTEQLGSQFELGWGNRFEKQALDFIPVMLACGASSGEALDHLLATRIMRPGKVTGRYNVSAETLRNLKGALEEFWISADLAGDPRKSMELLEADIRRLDGRS